MNGAAADWVGRLRARHEPERRRACLGVGDAVDDAPGVPAVVGAVSASTSSCARERGQPFEFTVDGEPGTLPAGVDLGLYRILEEALQSAGQVQGSFVGVFLGFGEDDVEIQLTASCHGPNLWLTSAMRERVALCGGQLHADIGDEDGWRFTARMPCGLQGALA